MDAMLEPAMLIGLSLVAVWLYVRRPGLRPRSLVRAVMHVPVSLCAYGFLPGVLAFLLRDIGWVDLRIVVVMVFWIPMLTYVLLSWVWLIARILHDLLGGKPRGGLPVTSET